MSSAREKRQQPASRVSFTPQTQEKLCPLLDSPPSPFVSSPNPISNGDQTEKGVSPPKQKAFIRSPLQVKVTSKNVKQSPKHLQATQKRKHKKAEAKEYPRTLLSNKTVAKQNSSQNREKNNPSRSHSKPSPRSSSKKENVRGKSSKSPRIKDNLDNHPEPIHPSSQYLEPLKFGSIVPESPNQEDKRFCLFEDEWVEPKPSKRRSIDDNTKSSRARNKKKKLFSWSPAIAYSQQTPKLKKSKHSLFSQDKTETYHKQKRSDVVDKTKQQSTPKKAPTTKGKKQALGAKHQHSASLSHVTEVKRSSKKIKTNQTEIIKEKERIENKARHTKDVSQTHRKNLRFKQSNQINTDTLDTQRLYEEGRSSCNRTKLGISQFPENELSTYFQQSDQDSPISNIACQSAIQSDDDQQESTHISHNQIQNTQGQLGTNYNRDIAGHKSPLRWKQSLRQYDLRDSDGEATHENSPSKQSPPPSSRFQSYPDPKATGEESNHSPHSPDGTNILWHILFQLKSTAASSQGQSNPPSPPAQSRVTEVGQLNEP